MKAIKAHTDWKIRIQSLINTKSTDDISLYDISRDDQCELGKWIKALDKEQGHTYALSCLRNFHREFHAAAANAMEHAQSGDDEQAQAIINGEYARLSREVVKSLLAMNKLSNSQSD